MYSISCYKEQLNFENTLYYFSWKMQQPEIAYFDETL
jgi:hypothetical protein